MFEAEAGVDDPEVQAAIEWLLVEIEDVDDVAAIQSPYDPEGARNVSESGRIAYANVQFEIEATDVPIELVDEMKALARDAERPGLDIALGGPIIAFNEFEVTVFLSFVFMIDEQAIKLFGLGLAVAISVDATIVRMVLVAATMEFLGDANCGSRAGSTASCPASARRGRASTSRSRAWPRSGSWRRSSRSRSGPSPH